MRETVPSDKPRITLYLSEELKAAVEIWADSESRRVSAQVGHLLEELLLKKKLLMIEPSIELKSELESLAKRKGMPVEIFATSLLLEAIQKYK
jgi:hypothetical protein